MLGLVVGCGSLDRLVTEPPPADQVRQRAEVAELIRLAEEMRSVPPAELEARYAETPPGRAEPSSPTQRVRLAILLAMGPESVRDEERARALLGQVTDPGSGAGAEVRALARLLDGMLAERRAFRRACDARIDAEAHRRRAVEQQLEELKAIEQQLNLR